MFMNWAGYHCCTCFIDWAYSWVTNYKLLVNVVNSWWVRIISSVDNNRFSFRWKFCGVHSMLLLWVTIISFSRVAWRTGRRDSRIVCIDARLLRWIAVIFGGVKIIISVLFVIWVVVVTVTLPLQGLQVENTAAWVRCRF